MNKNYTDQQIKTSITKLLEVFLRKKQTIYFKILTKTIIAYQWY